ncbi:MAG: CRISPR-associated protein Cas4 [Lachnospiraceae bacterium]|nr:CRISPR-associated protein Cas4 [Lachnospiraceae bacterium]
MEFKEEDYLQLSGLQHFSFCRRQWALIHIENQWEENFHTTDGRLLHENAHDPTFRESRGDLLTVRGLAVFSARLGISGQCDVVEFHRDPDGVSLPGRDGLWRPYPVEYKRGEPKENNADELQLCGQAMCLEEMLCCSIPDGALYYGTPRRRLPVSFTPSMREQVRFYLAEMHGLYQKHFTPKVKPSKACQSCSLKDLCLPKLLRQRKVSDYLAGAMEELS